MRIVICNVIKLHSYVRTHALSDQHYKLSADKLANELRNRICCKEIVNHFIHIRFIRSMKIYQLITVPISKLYYYLQ